MSTAATDRLVTQCFTQLQRLLTAAAPSMTTSTSKAVKSYFRNVSNWKVLDPKSSIQEQRAAIRAAYIAMPVEICRLLSPEDLAGMDALLAEELSHKRVVDALSLPEIVPGSGMSVWQGDMSVLRCDAVVNPGNNALLGCFLPSHRCLDNILHAESGPRLRLACADLLERLGLEEDANGNCRVTPGYGLPAQFVFHTVGPCLVENHRTGAVRRPNPTDIAELRSCYESCLNEALQLRIKSLAFCCISTGIFGYPQQEAATLAITTCMDWLERQKRSHSREEHDKVAAEAVSGEEESNSRREATATTDVDTAPFRIVFNVFKDEDLAVYQTLAPQLLSQDTTN